MLTIQNFKIDVNNMGHITNTYLIYSTNTSSAVLFDPAGDEDIILKFLNDNNIILKTIILTHCHGDHIFGIDKIKKITNAKLAICKDDEEGYYTDSINCCSYLGLDLPKSKIDIFLKDKQIYTVDDITLEVIQTPGHTKGSICLYQKSLNVLFSGDTVFSDCYGRTDLETGSFTDMQDSLKYIFEHYLNATILPGHGNHAVIRDITRRINLLMAIKKK